MAVLAPLVVLLAKLKVEVDGGAAGSEDTWIGAPTSVDGVGDEGAESVMWAMSNVKEDDTIPPVLAHTTARCFIAGLVKVLQLG